MAFDKANWACIGGNVANAPSLFSYKSTDTVATVNTANYFNDVYNDVKIGDFVFMHLDTGGTPQGYIAVIKDKSGGNVDIADGLALGTTDSD